ncbi:two component transcriptional regulator, AraC family [Paenibacillus curdlanolyticus YK9]|uniref:Two component transcriptional regulator, AraC family n=1 Tax=Paenibacillus curdlanolyticus YK9 TaxID=717606 RepID=E0ICQ1_9BACL|nr:response regulator [Paenibacillus curdlanolyticus]EFM09937.1 two component transcriptional regulator, AraC family [Paenibacillus curdlanolyticus YK9]
MKVMIVDDEEMIRLGLEKIMSKLHPNLSVVGSYSNGAVAWDNFAKLYSDGLDLVVTDIKMPFMDGIKLIEKIREVASDVQIIVLSGFEEFEYARAALRFGVKDYLLKPVDKIQLQERLVEIESLRQKALANKPEESAAPIEDREHHAVEQVKHELEQSYDQPFELEKLAQSVGMNGSYLSRLFRIQTNMTMTDYVIQLRIEKAKELLIGNPALRNYEISQLVGYHDPVYFNKLFKKTVGVTPKDYREGKRGTPGS